MRKLMVSLLVIMLSASFAWSADQPNITAQLTAQRVIKAGQGKEVLSPADTAKPGEVIEYRIVYKNSGKAMARGLQGVLPIPLEMEFIPGSAAPADVSASLDGKSFSKIPLQRKVKLADGSIVLRDVPVAEYRSLRWNLQGLAPGDHITAKARMRIKNDLRGPIAINPDSKNK